MIVLNDAKSNKLQPKRLQRVDDYPKKSSTDSSWKSQKNSVNKK